MNIRKMNAQYARTANHVGFKIKQVKENGTESFYKAC